MDAKTTTSQKSMPEQLPNAHTFREYLQPQRMLQTTFGSSNEQRG